MNPEIIRFAAVGIVILLSHCMEGITGFGCSVLALPFLAMLLGLKTAVPVLVVLGWVLSGYIILRSLKTIRWKEFFFIAIHVGLGLPAGILLFERLPAWCLTVLLALFMIGVGVQGIWKTYRGRNIAPPQTQSDSGVKQNRTILMRAVLFCGGIIHGAFGSGGPFVVIYASRALPEKSLFRVTLSLLWFTLNSALIVQWTWSGGIWNPGIRNAVLIASPFLIAGMLLGDYLHHRVNEYFFKMIVYTVLFLAGLLTAYSIV